MKKIAPIAIGIFAGFLGACGGPLAPHPQLSAAEDPCASFHTQIEEAVHRGLLEIVRNIPPDIAVQSGGFGTKDSQGNEFFLGTGQISISGLALSDATLNLACAPTLSGALTASFKEGLATQFNFHFKVAALQLEQDGKVQVKINGPAVIKATAKVGLGLTLTGPVVDVTFALDEASINDISFNVTATSGTLGVILKRFLNDHKALFVAQVTSFLKSMFEEASLKIGLSFSQPKEIDVTYVLPFTKNSGTAHFSL
jgi:hypothetical protein